MEQLRFEPEKHKYFLGTREIPSVSNILQKVGLSKDYKGIDPWYAARGTAVHKAIELHLQGVLDKDSLDEAIKPQFRAFLAYWESHKQEKILALEKPMVDIAESFAGTPDLVTSTAVYDWKCSKSHDRVAELQGQAYKIMAMANGYPVMPFIVVELHEDGTFAEFNYGDSMDQWESVMDLYRWRISK